MKATTAIDTLMRKVMNIKMTLKKWNQTLITKILYLPKVKIEENKEQKKRKLTSKQLHKNNRMEEKGKEI